jgi:hypothetical protein
VHDNGKMRHVETIPGMGTGMIKNSMYHEFDMIHCKNFCKCHNVPPVQQ